MLKFSVFEQFEFKSHQQNIFVKISQFSFKGILLKKKK